MAKLLASEASWAGRQRLPRHPRRLRVRARSTTSSASSARRASTGRADLEQPDPRLRRPARARHAAVVLGPDRMAAVERLFFHAPRSGAVSSASRERSDAGQEPDAVTGVGRAGERQHAGVGTGSRKSRCRSISAAAASPSPRSIAARIGAMVVLDVLAEAGAERVAAQVGLEHGEDRLRGDAQQRVAGAVDQHAVELLVVVKLLLDGELVRVDHRRAQPVQVGLGVPRRALAGGEALEQPARLQEFLERDVVALRQRPDVGLQEGRDVVDGRQRHERPAARALGGADEVVRRQRPERLPDRPAAHAELASRATSPGRRSPRASSPRTIRSRSWS